MKKERILKYLILICVMFVSFFIFTSNGVSALDFSVNDDKIILELEPVDGSDKSQGYIINGARLADGVASVEGWVMPDTYDVDEGGNLNSYPIIGIKDSDNNLSGVLSNISEAVSGSVVLGKNMQFLGVCSFCNFEQVTSYELNEKLANVGEYAFAYNSSLENVIVKAYNNDIRTVLANSNTFNSSTLNLKRFVFKNGTIAKTYKDSDVWKGFSVLFTYKIIYRFYNEDRLTLVNEYEFYNGEVLGVVPSSIDKKGLEFSWVSESGGKVITTSSLALDVNHVDEITLTPVHYVYPSWKLKGSNSLYIKTELNGEKAEHTGENKAIVSTYSGKNSPLNISAVLSHDFIDLSTGVYSSGFSIDYYWAKTGNGIEEFVSEDSHISIFQTGESGKYKCVVTINYVGYASIVEEVTIDVTIVARNVTINVKNKEYEYGSYIDSVDDVTGEYYVIDSTTSMADGEMIKNFKFTGYCNEFNTICEKNSVGIVAKALSGIVMDVGYAGDLTDYSSQYNFTYIKGDLTVVPKVIEHEIENDVEVLYGVRENLIQTKIVPIYGENETISIKYIREDESNLNVGTYDILSASVIKNNQVDPNYDIKLVSGSTGRVIIKPKPVEVNWNVTGGNVYDGNEKVVSATYENLAMHDIALTVNIKKNGVNSKIVNSGTYSLLASMVVVDYNYELVGYEHSITIEKADSILSGNQIQSVVYNGKAQSVNVTLNHSEGVIKKVPVNGGVCKNAGQSSSSYCAINVSVDETENYKATSGIYYLNILKYRLEVTPRVFEKTYGSAIGDYELCDTYLGVGEENVSICFHLNNTTNSAILPVGEYDIHSASTNESINYNIVLASGSEKGKIKVVPAPIEIRFYYYEGLVYDGKVKDIKVKYLGTTDDVGLSLDYGDKSVIKNAGDYRIDAVISNSNYYIEGDSYIEFTIAKAKYDVSKLKLNDSTVKFNFKNHFILLEGEVPEGLSISYTINGQKGNGTYLPFKHTVQVSFAGDYENYEYIEPLTATLHVDMTWVWVTLSLILFFVVAFPIAIYVLIKYKVIKFQYFIRRSRVRKMIRKNRELDKLNAMFREKQALWHAEQEEAEEIEIIEEPVKFVKKSIGHIPEGIIAMSFVDELFRSSYGTKQFYSEVKNELLSYEGIVSKIKRDYETFYLNNIPVAKLDVVDGVFYVYFALDPNSYKQDEYKHENVSKEKDFVAVPLKLKVDSIESLRHAKMFVRIIRKREGIKAVSNFIRTDYVSVYTAKESSLSMFKKSFVKKGTKEYFED